MVIVGDFIFKDIPTTIIRGPLDMETRPRSALFADVKERADIMIERFKEMNKDNPHFCITEYKVHNLQIAGQEKMKATIVMYFNGKKAKYNFTIDPDTEELLTIYFTDQWTPQAGA